MDNTINYSGDFVGKYHLIEKLGNGFFGSVYRAFDSVLKTEKAIKIMNVNNPQQAIALFKEAELPYKCQHNNIVKINAGSLETHREEVCFVVDMELANEGSIEAMLKKHKISVVDSVNITKNILFGLQFSHDQGIIHRDIKPANILMSAGIPKLSDFGLATALNSVLPNETLWYTTHKAPEIHNVNIATTQTDIYALGITLFRMVNDITDWHSYLASVKDSNKLTEKGTLVEKVGFEPYVPQKLIRIVRKACRPQPKDRFKSATEMRDALEKLAPIINWHKISDYEWCGKKDKANYNIRIINRKNYFDVAIRINNRKSNSISQSFRFIDEAKIYMYNYIASNTFK